MTIPAMNRFRPAKPRFLALLAALVLWPKPSLAVTEEECRTDYQAMLSAIEENRELSLAEIKRQLAEAPPEQQETLKEMQEQTWMQEEQDRRQAGFFHRDCLRAAKG